MKNELEEMAEDLVCSVRLTEENWLPIKQIGINHLYEFGQTALGLAVESAREDNVIFLVEHGADINLNQFVPPLMDAYHIGLPRIFVYLLIKGADLGAESKAGTSLKEDIDILGYDYFLRLFPKRRIENES